METKNINFDDGRMVKTELIVQQTRKRVGQASSRPGDGSSYFKILLFGSCESL